MASPFRFFRKYQARMFMILGVLLMFAFVVLPPFAEYLASNSGGPRTDSTVATWKHGEISQNEVARRMQAEYIIQEFLQRLMEQAQAKGGSPKARPISPANNDREIVRRMVLAEKAKSLGVVMSDDALLDYFDLISDRSFKTREEYLLLLRTVTGKKMSSLAVLNQIRSDLLAQRMFELAIGGALNTSPGLLWEYHQKLNHQVVCRILPVKSDSLIAQVTQKPTSGQIEKLYQAGKTTYPNPLNPEPGFKIRRQASFGYFVAVFDDFLTKEVELRSPAITDEDITKYYDDNKQQFQELDLPPEDPNSPPDSQPKDPPSEKGSVDPGDTIPPSPKDPAEKPETPKPDPEPKKPDANKEAEKKPAEKAEPKKKAPAAEPKKQPDAKNKKGPSEDLSLSDLTQVDSQYFVVAQDPKKEPPPKNEKKADKEKVTDKKPATTKQPPEKKSDPKKKGTNQGKSGTKPPANSSEKSKPADDKTETVEKPDPTTPPTTPEKTVRYKPLDDKLKQEIRERIAKEKGRAPALDAMQKSLETARRSLERYSNALALADDPELNRTKPAPPDFKSLAEKFGLQYRQTPPLDLLKISMTPALADKDDPPYADLLRATEFNLQSRGGMPPSIRFRDLAAGPLLTEDIEDAALFQPRTISTPYALSASFGFPPERVFVFWIYKLSPERVPKLGEIKSQVAQTWKSQQAFELAKDQAQATIARLNDQKKSLSDVVTEEEKMQLIETEAFSWMTTGALGSQGNPMLSQVRGKNGEEASVSLKDLGEPFMEEVFGLSPGEFKVIHDLPKKTAYAVELVSAVMDEMQLRELFLVTGSSAPVFQLAQADHIEFLQEWYQELDKEFDVQWLDDDA